MDGFFGSLFGLFVGYFKRFGLLSENGRLGISLQGYQDRFSNDLEKR